MDKLRIRQELQSYRIVRRNVIKIVNSIPFNNMSLGTYQALINSNVTIPEIKQMYKEIYTNLAKPQYNRSLIKIELDFETILMQWLNDTAGLRIISVHQTLIDSIVSVIAQGYNDNLSVAEITRNLQKSFGWYKAQALRIARTETTTATNYATTLAAENSEFELEKTWISVQDNRTRRPPNSVYDHLDMNGVKVDADKPFFTSGEEIMYPGDPMAKAGNVINCRCKVVYTVKEDADGLPIRKIKN
jgi:uncharacterized protein with gpF-like domain